MPWLQLTLTTDRDRSLLLEAVLQNAGALAVTLGDAGDEPQFEPRPGTTPLWREVKITALFEDEPGARARLEQLAQSISTQTTAPAALERLQDRLWERAWMKDFTPRRFGDRLWICPRGSSPEADDAVVVTLDPGLAFGTGHHPTTELCLRWLDKASLAGETLMDFGCGSGILAIAALRLGAARAIAVDHDPQALEATAANAVENRVEDRLEVCTPEGRPDVQVEILIANILAGPLLELAPAFARQVCPGGRLVLSGLLPDQVPQVSGAYQSWFRLQEPEIAGDWVLLSGQRRVEV